MQPHEILTQLSQQAIYLMGISFILGSLCTIFVLLILDMLRRLRPDWTEELRNRSDDDEDDSDINHAA